MSGSDANALPPDFARIPPTALPGAVLPTVAGTPQAQEAVISNSIPQTATVPLKNGPTFTPSFDGAPQWAAVPGTPLMYVVNASTPIIEVSPGAYYAVVAGVWFTAPQVTGPWTIATSVPPSIYTIPPASPLHYVTYVRIYEATPDYVYVGYTPGYMGTVVTSYGTVVYGTGYTYTPWIVIIYSSQTGKTTSWNSGNLGNNHHADSSGNGYRNTAAAGGRGSRSGGGIGRFRRQSMVRQGRRQDDDFRSARAAMAALFAALMWLTACSPLSMTVKRYPDIPPQPQTSADQVEILRKQPTRPHFAVGAISVSTAPDNPDLPARLREAAAQLGANAVVLHLRRRQAVGPHRHHRRRDPLPLAAAANRCRMPDELNNPLLLFVTSFARHVGVGVVRQQGAAQAPAARSGCARRLQRRAYRDAHAARPDHRL